MAERRSLGAALLSGDKLAFIAGGIPAKVTEPPPVIAAAMAAEAETEPAASHEPTRPRIRRPRTTSRTPRQSEETVVDFQTGEGSFLGPILVPLTTRLQPHTADALRRACLEQRLRRKRPHTQQQIVEIAVSTWLKANGYLDQA